MFQAKKAVACGRCNSRKQQRVQKAHHTSEKRARQAQLALACEANAGLQRFRLRKSLFNGPVMLILFAMHFAWFCFVLRFALCFICIVCIPVQLSLALSQLNLIKFSLANGQHVDLDWPRVHATHI